MFVGAINSTVREFLASVACDFEGKTLVIGCSGNFTSESVLSKYARPDSIHSNDVSFYSCMLGRWLTGQPVRFEIVDPAFDWLAPYLETDLHRLAAIMTLLDMLEFEKRNNPHRVRMWELHRRTFGDLVNQTAERLAAAGAEMRVTSFYEGDVLAHFERFGDDPEAVFCCYAPTYAGGYERLYKRLDKIVSWDKPAYEMLNDARRDALLDWMRARRFLWYDDRRIEGMEPVMEQRGSLTKTVYLYSNIVERPGFFDSVLSHQAVNKKLLPLPGRDFEIRPDSEVRIERIKTTDLSQYKDIFLAKNIKYTSGLWGFSIFIAGQVVGFFEFKIQGTSSVDQLYLLSDFAVAGTRYNRLSKLVLMLVKSEQTRKILERINQMRLRSMVTIAFTNKPVSMKYRGVFDLIKRGETKDGQKFLNYAAEFNNLTWQETLSEWLTRHGSTN